LDSSQNHSVLPNNSCGGNFVSLIYIDSVAHPSLDSAFKTEYILEVGVRTTREVMDRTEDYDTDRTVFGFNANR